MLRFGSDVPRALLLSALLAVSAASACTTNHDALARAPKAGASNGGGGGLGGGGFGNFGNTGNDTTVGGRPNPDVEPAGANVLTIVNGVVDAPSIELCFARVSANGETGELVGEPSSELRYGAHLVFATIDGFSFADDTVQPWVLAGDFSLIDGMDCETAVALALSEEAKVTPDPGREPVAGAGQGGDASGGGSGGEFTAGGTGPTVGSGGAPAETPALRARPVAALPSGTVNIGRSILLVLSGCLGGAAFTDAVETAACGDAYTPYSPTLEPVVVKLSRTLEYGKVGLQGLHASQATGSLDLRVSGDKGAVALVFASGVGFGAIEPRPADTRFTPGELGVEQRNFGLQAIDISGQVAAQAAWSEVLQNAGLSVPDATRNYTAIYLGPEPLLLKQGWWNPPIFTLVDNDPTRD